MRDKYPLFFLSLFFPVLLYGADKSKAKPDYSQMLSHFNILAQGNPQIASIVEYGKSVEGRPLVLMRFGKKKYTSATTRPALLVTGVTHGHEYINVVDQLPGWVLSEEKPLANFFDQGGVFYVVPVFNPDGYAIAERLNKNQIDLNRDFDVIPTQKVKFTQPETKAFATFLERDLTEKNASLKYAMSYHCCGRGETGYGWGDTAEVGYPWAYTKKSLPESQLAEYKALGELIRNAFDNKYIQAGAWSKILYSAQGVATDYYYAKYGAMSFVFEGKENYEAQRINHHFSMWKTLAEQALVEKP